MESRYRDLRTVGERKLIHAGKDCEVVELASWYQNKLSSKYSQS